MLSFPTSSLMTTKSEKKESAVSGRRNSAPRRSIDSPAPTAPAAKTSFTGSLWRSASGKIVASVVGVVIVAGAIGAVIAANPTSMTDAVAASQSGQGAADFSQLAAQRDQVLAADNTAIGQAGTSAALKNRDSVLSDDASAIKDQAAKLKSEVFLWPTTGGITSGYGMRVDPVTGVYQLHDGIDIGAPCGQNVYAAQSGTVTIARMGYSAGEGNDVHVADGDINGAQVETAYFHLTNFVVAVGQQVQKGQLIGHVGSTGNSTGCHLHFMVHANGLPTSPLNYIVPPPGDGAPASAQYPAPTAAQLAASPAD